MLSCRRSKSTSAGNDDVLAAGSFVSPARAFLRLLEANFRQETIKSGVSKLRIARSCFPAALEANFRQETIKSGVSKLHVARLYFPAAARDGRSTTG